MRKMPAMPMFDPAGPFDAAQRDYMMVLLGCLLASGVPIGDAKKLALEIALHVTGRMRENLGRETGPG